MRSCSGDFLEGLFQARKVAFKHRKILLLLKQWQLNQPFIFFYPGPTPIPTIPNADMRSSVSYLAHFIFHPGRTNLFSDLAGISEMRLRLCLEIARDPGKNIFRGLKLISHFFKKDMRDSD
jgi:hypothetical protein